MTEEKKKRENAGDIVVVSDILPGHLFVIPLADRPLFPGITVPLTLSGKRYIEILDKLRDQSPGVAAAVLVHKKNDVDIFKSDVYNVGVVVKILKVIPIGPQSVQVVVTGIQRFEKVKVTQSEPHLIWEVKYHSATKGAADKELKAYKLSIISAVKELVNVNPMFQDQLKMIYPEIDMDDLSGMMDLIASVLHADREKLQQVLEAFSLNERAMLLLIYLREELELMKIKEKISKQINEKVSKQQREYYLKEQLKAIRKELGLEKDPKHAEIEKFEKRLAGLKLTEEAEKVIQEKLDNLRTLEPASPEYGVLRSYLDILTELPWGVYSKDLLSLKKARSILHKSHFGLDDVKELILQFISTGIKRKKLTGSSILLVGPPGVGKTSIGQSVAEALNRKFYRFSLGGMRDEAEIKGHRRTYVGAIPGKLIEAVRRTGTSNPVIMLDEIDKLGISFQGDPASALLEVLDPEQNKNFLDHYLDVRFDLSNVLFMATANQVDTIPPPLLDRMEIIRLSGYILEEKIQIARRHLIPKQAEQHGLGERELTLSENALRVIADRYAREAGVRDMEKQIKKIMRKFTLRQAEHKPVPRAITPKNLEDFLGKPVFTKETLYNKDVPGVALGLAYTALGGSTLYIEANAIRSKTGSFKLTGQLGDVMKESASIALSHVRSLTCGHSSLSRFFETNAIHVHVPAGATPKDGPSAGITIALALFSLATGRPVRSEVTMTGELTITGKVLPIGGVREKTIAARRVGLSEIILPRENERDFDELPAYIKKGLTVHHADYFQDVLKVVYGEKFCIPKKTVKKMAKRKK